MTILLGFDPGRDKCGIAVLGDHAQLLFHEVLPSEAVLAKLPQLCQQFGVEQVVMGNQTTSKQWQAQLTTVL
ncbi:MAG: resolvase, partial [Microcystaceae cyanobacterium]